MAETVGEVFVRVRPDSSGFQREASGPIAAAGSALGKAFVAAFAVGGAAKTIESIVHAATEHQAAFAVLDQTTKNAGASNDLFGQSIESLLEKEARLKGFSDEELASGFQRLVAVTHDSAKAFKDLGAVEDLARFRHIDLATAALAVSKAEQGSVTALQRYGIVVPQVTAATDRLKLAHDQAVAAGAKLTETQKEEYKQALLTAAAQDKQARTVAALALIQQRAGGSAAVFANTASGQFERLQQDFHQFEVAVGAGLLSSLAGAAEGLGAFFTKAAESERVRSDINQLTGDIRVGLTDIKDVAETVGPPLITVAQDAKAVVSAIGLPALLAAAAAYKGVGLAVDGVRAAQAFYAKAVAASTGVTAASAGASAAAAGAAGTDAAAMSALTAAIVANTAALGVNDAAIAETVTIYGAYGAELATVTLANQALAASEAEVAVAAGAEGAAGGLGAFASGIAALIGPEALAVAGAAALAGGIVYLETRESATTRATHQLADALSGLADAEKQIPADRLAVAEDKLALKRAQTALATSQAAHSSLEYQQQLLDVANASLTLDGAQTTLQQGLKDVGAEFDLQKQKAIDLAKAITGAATASRPRQDFGAAASLTGPGRQAAQFATDVQASFQKAIDAGKKFSDVQLHNRDLLVQFAEVYGRIPTNKQISLILDNRSATIGLDAIRRKIEGLPAISGPAAAAAATELVHRFNAATIAGAAQFGLGPAISRQFSVLPAQVAPAATAAGGSAWSTWAQALLAAAAATGIPGLVAVTQEQLDLLAPKAGPNAAAAGSTLGSDLLTGFAAVVFPGFNSIITQIDTEIAAAKQAAAQKAIDTATAPLRQSIQSDKADLAQIGTDMAAAVKQGAQALSDSVNQAKANLNTIGQDLVSSLQQFIEKPLVDEQAKISAAQARLTLIGDKTTLRNLSAEVLLPGGKALSQDPTKAIAQLEALAKSTKSPALETFLQHYQAAALQEQSDQLATKQSVAQAIEQHAQTRIANLTDLFNTGRISQATLEKDIVAIFRKQGLTPETARARGAAFADTLAGQLTGLSQQASAIKSGPQQPGSGLIPSIVRPLDTLEATQKQVAGIAKQQRDKQLAEAKTQTQLLQKIHGAQAGSKFSSSLDHNPGNKTRTGQNLVGTGG